jgi:hypothetical protein
VPRGSNERAFLFANRAIDDTLDAMAGENLLALASNCVADEDLSWFYIKTRTQSMQLIRIRTCAPV